jgi:hypothetical protein
MTEPLAVEQVPLTSWRQIVEGADYLSAAGWVFRGLAREEWELQTSLEREFGRRGGDAERILVRHFLRRAPRLLQPHLVPDDDDTAAWLGLIQHYGGPTRLLDVTRSPYVALFFAFEPAGEGDRAVWAIQPVSCQFACMQIMADAERVSRGETHSRLTDHQRELVYSLVTREPHLHPAFASFRPFTGVFPLDPWKPDVRQSAQQAMFLCAANPAVSFSANLANHPTNVHRTPIYKFVLPASIREEALTHLSRMNVIAATLFPDLDGLARSLRTLLLGSDIGFRNRNQPPPWEAK